MNTLKSRLLNAVPQGAALFGDDKARAAVAKMQEEFRIEVPTDGKFTAQEYTLATVSLMTGPRAQRPSFRAIRKTIRRMRSGQPVKGSWRSWKAV